MNDIKISADLIQFIQSQYVAHKYTEGMYVFAALDEDVVEVVVRSFLVWAEEHGLFKEDKLDISALYIK